MTSVNFMVQTAGVETNGVSTTTCRELAKGKCGRLDPLIGASKNRLSNAYEVR